MGSKLSLLTRIERVVARELRLRDCLLRLRAIGQRALAIDRPAAATWQHVIAERQGLLDTLEELRASESEQEASLLATGSDSGDLRLQEAAAQARRTAEGNAALLAEVIDLDAAVEAALREHLAALADTLAKPARKQQVQAAYRPSAAADPRFLDGRR